MINNGYVEWNINNGESTVLIYSPRRGRAEKNPGMQPGQRSVPESSLVAVKLLVGSEDGQMERNAARVKEEDTDTRRQIASALGRNIVESHLS